MNSRVGRAIVFLVVFTIQSFCMYGIERGKIVVKTKEGKEIELYEGGYAFIVGNSNYTNGWDPLPGTLKDVDEVAAVLKKFGYNVTLKKNLDRKAFDKEFMAFSYYYGRSRENQILFYYAGHGYTEKMANEEDMGYIVMVDAPLPESDPINFKLSSVDMQFFITQAKMIQSKHVLFVFDSCFSGTILNLRTVVTPEYVSDNVKYPVRQFITAGKDSETVPDRSVFKQAFLDLLEGKDKEPFPDGNITGEEIGFYLKQKVPQYNPKQHPQYGKISDPKLDKGDFVFVHHKKYASPPNIQPFSLNRSMLGKQYLALIAINQYKHWRFLKGPVNDAKKIKNILNSRYYIDVVLELYDEAADKAGIVKLFNNLQAELKPEDSLLIFYSGHAYLDRASETGYLIPVDGGLYPNLADRWIPNSQIIGYINQIKSNHIFLINDSSFGGALVEITRGISPGRIKIENSGINNEYFRRAYAKCSRLILTSGDISEAVPDISELVPHLIDVLKNNDNQYIDAFSLYNEIRVGMKRTMPIFGPIRGTNHQQGGTFLLFLKEKFYK